MKNGMQMMLESMLPPGFMDKLQTEFIPFIGSLDARLTDMQKTITALQNQLTVISGTLENVVGKIDHNHVDQSTPAQDAAFFNQSHLEVHGA